MTIWIDTREAAKHADVLALISEQVETEMRELPADFLISASSPNRPLLVERKTVNNLLLDFSTGHLWTQIRNALRYEEADYCIVLETRDYWSVNRFRNWEKGRVMRIVESIIFDWKIRIIPSYTPEWTAEWLVYKHRELQGTTEGPRAFPLRIRPPLDTLRDKQRYLIEGLPGISAVLAERLLEHFGSPRAVFQASEEALKKVPGIGEKRAREITKVLDGKPT